MSEYVPEDFVARSEYPVIVSILNASSVDHRYHLITCEHGTGKTSLILRASCDVGSGVFYFPIMADAVADLTFDLAIVTKYAYSLEVVDLMHLVGRRLGVLRSSVFFFGVFAYFQPSPACYQYAFAHAVYLQCCRGLQGEVW